MASRRSRGDGGLSWDGARQRWVASVTVGYTPGGMRIFKRARGRTKTEAQRKLKELIRDYDDGLAIGPYGYTVADAVGDWQCKGWTSNIMRTESFHADDLAKALRRCKIATMPELKRALGTEVDV